MGTAMRGWRAVGNPDEFGHLRDKSLTNVKTIWDEWSQKCGRKRGWQRANLVYREIIPPTRTPTPDDLCQAQRDEPDHAIGNIVRRTDSQLDLYLPAASLEMENIEAACCVHPLVKKVKRCTGKLMNKGVHLNHIN